MNRNTLCTTCGKRFRRATRKRSAFVAIRRQVRARFTRIRQAVIASAEIRTELRLVSAASLLCGVATVVMVYVISTVFDF